MDIQAGSKLTIMNSTISGNGSHGLYANRKTHGGGTLDSGIIEATNVIVEDNGGYGVVSADGNITVDTITASGNTLGNIANIQKGFELPDSTRRSGCQTADELGSLFVNGNPGEIIEGTCP